MKLDAEAEAAGYDRRHIVMGGIVKAQLKVGMVAPPASTGVGMADDSGGDGDGDEAPVAMPT